MTKRNENIYSHFYLVKFRNKVFDKKCLLTSCKFYYLRKSLVLIVKKIEVYEKGIVLAWFGK